MLDLYQLKHHIYFPRRKYIKSFRSWAFWTLWWLYVYFIGFLFSRNANSPHYMGHLVKVTILQNLVQNLMIWLKTSNLKRTRTKGWKRWYVKFNLNCNKFWILFQTNLTSLEGLSKFIDPSQLTPDLEGGLSYDHGIWIELRCVSTAFRLLRQTEMLCFISLLSMWQEYCYSAVCYLSCPMGILNQRQHCSQLTEAWCWQTKIKTSAAMLRKRDERSQFIFSLRLVSGHLLSLVPSHSCSPNDDKRLSELLSAV